MLSSPNVNAVKKNFFFNLRSKNQTSFTYKYMLTHVFWFLLLCTIITYNHLFEMSKNVLRGRILSLILCAIFFLFINTIQYYLLFIYYFETFTGRLGCLEASSGDNLELFSPPHNMNDIINACALSPHGE